MIDRKTFYGLVRARLFHGSMTQAQVEGINAVLDGWEADYGTEDVRWLAYCLATDHHETDRKMQPIEEYGNGAGHLYGKRFRINGQSYTYTDTIAYGRGLVQLTWIDNYEKAGMKRGVAYPMHPELLLTLEHAVPIMFLGMMEGWFTGHKLADYIHGATCDYYNARRIINGTDRADLVAGYASTYETALRAAGMPDFSDVQGGHS